MAEGTLSWKQLRHEATQRLRIAFDDDRSQEARWIVERVSGYSASELMIHDDEPVSVRSVAFFDELLDRREAFEQVGLFREDLPYTADWEWYVRSALRFAWHHQPENLARYRIHTDNLTHELAKSGATARDVRRTLELFARMIPANIANQALPASRQLHAQRFLATALRCLEVKNVDLANRLIRESLAMCADAVDS